MTRSKRKSASAGEPPKRLKPKSNVLRELFFLSGNECAMKGCKTVLIDGRGTMVGEVGAVRHRRAIQFARLTTRLQPPTTMKADLRTVSPDGSQVRELDGNQRLRDVRRGRNVSIRLGLAQNQNRHP